ncbi:DUF2726 domain-containing protein [Salmonella enterica]|nr:DUF2726 domain-containing protein [Salmonella enterica]HDO5799827.1 DUF2726 domain-containing protein [Salmonella enterica subsp. enterica serovar Typhimurium]HED0201636.1 DUF2726 domain-containing protein [Salmonella enterica subsp. enterica serovar Orientalis]
MFFDIQGEGFFERVILSACANYFVFLQARLIDIIAPSVSRNSNNSLHFTLFRSSSQYSVDFIIVRKVDYKVVCVVEFDSSTHDWPDSVRRDLKLNTVLESADIFILQSRSPDFLIDAIKSRFF